MLRAMDHRPPQDACKSTAAIEQPKMQPKPENPFAQQGSVATRPTVAVVSTNTCLCGARAQDDPVALQAKITRVPITNTGKLREETRQMLYWSSARQPMRQHIAHSSPVEIGL